MSDRFDVVVVGARCAGSPLATLLAREGVRVALVERAKFPRDTLSTHIFEAPGINVLGRLGVLNRVCATGAEPIRHLDFRHDEFATRVEPTPRPGDIGGAMSVRRFLLDPILAEAAEDAGAEVMMETKVTGLVQNGRVTGVRVSSGGSERELSARLVVGADGRNSTVAKLTGARKYHVVPSERCLYWGFFEGADTDPEPEIVFHHWDGRVVIACPADSGLYQVVVIPENRLVPQFRTDLERAFMEQARACAPVAEKLRRARRVGKLLGIVRWESFFRESAGRGSMDLCSCPSSRWSPSHSFWSGARTRAAQPWVQSSPPPAPKCGHQGSLPIDRRSRSRCILDLTDMRAARMAHVAHPSTAADRPPHESPTSSEAHDGIGSDTGISASRERAPATPGECRIAQPDPVGVSSR